MRDLLDYYYYVAHETDPAIWLSVMLKSRFSGEFCVAQESRGIKHGVHVTVYWRAASAPSVSLVYYGYLTILLRFIATADKEATKENREPKHHTRRTHTARRTMEHEASNTTKHNTQHNAIVVIPRHRDGFRSAGPLNSLPDSSRGSAAVGKHSFADKLTRKTFLFTN